MKSSTQAPRQEAMVETRTAGSFRWIALAAGWAGAAGKWLAQPPPTNQPG